MTAQQEQNSNGHPEQSKSRDEEHSPNESQHDMDSKNHLQDPVHNTGNEKMSIDEEGAEIQPGDEV